VIDLLKSPCLVYVLLASITLAASLSLLVTVALPIRTTVVAVAGCFTLQLQLLD
jgi:hypothetical protein